MPRRQSQEFGELLYQTLKAMAEEGKITFEALAEIRRRAIPRSGALARWRRGEEFVKGLKLGVSQHVPDEPRAVLVAACPSPLDVARDEPLSGPDAKALERSILAPLGLSRGQVAILHAVPVEVGGESPSVEAITKWAPWIAKALDDIDAPIIALGRAAREALGDRAQWTLPHPAGLRRRGIETSPEIIRKSASIQKALDEPRAPSLGWLGDEGRFVILERFHGLTPEQTELSRDELAAQADIEHAVGLHLGAEDILRGFEVESPEWDAGFDASELPAHSSEWLTVTEQGVYAPAPGVRIFEVARGSYQTRTKERGRARLEMRPTRGSAPFDPGEDKKFTIDLCVEYRVAPDGPKWRVWTAQDRPERQGDHHIAICKASADRGIAIGPALNPYQVDEHGHWVHPADAEEAAHRYLETSRVVGLGHKRRARGAVVESYLLPYPSREDYRAAMEGGDHAIWEFPFRDERDGRLTFLPSGTWMLGVRFDGDDRERLRDGDINAFSIGGLGKSRPMKAEDLPRVTVEPLPQPQAA